MGARTRLAVGLLLALALGVAGLSVVFTDVGPGETPAGRLLGGAAGFLLAGLLVGAVCHRGRGWLAAGAAAWGPVLLGAVGLWVWLTEPASGWPGLALLLLVGPLALALVGGWLGARLRRRLAGRGAPRRGTYG